MGINILIGISIIAVVSFFLIYLLRWSIREINQIGKKQKTMREILQERKIERRTDY